MSRKKDPFPITDIYLLEMNAVDAGTKFLEMAKKISNYNKVTINGISYKTLKKL